MCEDCQNEYLTLEEQLASLDLSEDKSITVGNAVIISEDTYKRLSIAKASAGILYNANNINFQM